MTGHSPGMLSYEFAASSGKPGSSGETSVSEARLWLSEEAWRKVPLSELQPQAASDSLAGGETEKTKLDSLIGQEFSNTTQAQNIRQSLAKFEERAVRESLPKEELEAAYGDLARILTHSEVLSPDERRLLVQQTLMHLAEPSTIDQGIHPTCGYAAVQARLMARHPSAATRFIAQVSTTGSYTLSDYRQISLDTDSLRPNWGEQQRLPPGGRTYASQLFQVAAANIRWQTESADERLGRFAPGSKRYVQSTDRTQSRTGDGVFDTDSGTLTPDWGGYATQWHLSFVENEITKKTNQHHIFDYTTTQQLRAALVEAKARNDFPALVLVPMTAEPIRSDYIRHLGRQPSSNSNHWINVTNYDVASDTVDIDNFMGKSSDHQNVSLGKLYELPAGPLPKPGDFDSKLYGSMWGGLLGAGSALALDVGVARLGLRAAAPRLGLGAVVVLGGVALGAYAFSR